jgi:hypothetical protein
MNCFKHANAVFLRAPSQQHMQMLLGVCHADSPACCTSPPECRRSWTRRCYWVGSQRPQGQQRPRRCTTWRPAASCWTPLRRRPLRAAHWTTGRCTPLHFGQITENHRCRRIVVGIKVLCFLSWTSGVIVQLAVSQRGPAIYAALLYYMMLGLAGSGMPCANAQDV